jgi:hypothetical protein
MRVPDAVWVSTLLLLTLQASFLLPPVGYALMMTRGTLKSSVPTAALVRALAPFLAVQLCVLALTLSLPRIVHMLEPENTRSRGIERPMTKEEVDRQLQMQPWPFAMPPSLEPPGSSTDGATKR